MPVAAETSEVLLWRSSTGADVQRFNSAWVLSEAVISQTPQPGPSKTGLGPGALRAGPPNSRSFLGPGARSLERLLP